MPTTITSGNIMAAALVMQVCLGVIFGIGAWTIWIQSSHIFGKREYLLIPWAILLFTLITAIILIFSAPFAPYWGPLLGDISFSGINQGLSLLITFLATIFEVHWLIGKTGGSARSIFSPVLFSLPALAIFLRDTSWHLGLYVTLIMVTFSWNLLKESEEDRDIENASGLWLIAISCLLLTTFIGFITRPK